MAKQKRKRQSTRIATNKRPKYDSLSSGDEDGFWKADRILAERHTRNKLEYKIQWEGTDPATGQNWAPTWEPASNVNEALLDEWLADKAVQETSESAHDTRAPESARSTPTHQSPAQPRPRGRPPRSARVISSSPESEPSLVASPATPFIQGHLQSSAITTSVGVLAQPTRVLRPLVCVRPELNSARRAEYERYSQLLPSQVVEPLVEESQPEPENTQETDLDSSKLFAAAHNFSSGIVPDSQSSASEASYVVTTQASTSAHTTQHTDSSPEEASEDTGLLEIIQAASDAGSTVESIPETVAGTEQDSESQTQRQQLRRQTETPGTFEQLEFPIPSTQVAARRDQSQPEQSVAVQQNLAELALRDTLREEHVQEDIVQQLSVQPDVQETAAQQEAIEEDSGVTDIALSVVAQQEPLRQEEEQAHHTAESQRTTQSEHVEGRQQEHSQQETYRQATTQPEAARCEDHQSTQPETIQDETVQQDTVQQQTVQFDLAENTPQPAQDIDQATLVISNNQDTARLSTSTQSIEVASLEQSVETVTDLSVELSIDLTHVGRTTEGTQEAPGHPGDIDESDTPAQVPEQATPHTQVRAQTPNITSPVKDDTSCITERRNSTGASQPLHYPEHSTDSREQNAQLVASSARLSTQEHTTESIRLTIEVDQTSAQNSPGSRHDSSQETPERHRQSFDSSSSPIASPPNHSFGAGTLSQNVPPRPLTPRGSSSPRTMTDTSATEKRVREQLEEMKTKHLAENPFTPRFQRKPRSTLTPAPAAEASANNPLAPPRSTTSVPSVNVTLDGTRSPSTVPDRSPAPQAPTSLRTVALANSREQATGEAQKEPLQVTGTGPRAEHAEFVAAVAAAAASKPKVPSEEPMEIDEEESSDVDDEGSVLNDDLQLESEEYIVPLFIEGRQSDMYLSYIKDNRELLEDFLKDSQNFEPIAKVEEVLSRMRAIETHMDLVYAEAESASRKDIESAARFGVENSAKFRFLHTLFLNLRDENKHVILVTEQDNDSLFSILETFCKANSFNFNMPTKGVCASSESLEGNLLITIFPGTASPITRAADLIVCLDGVQSATKIRQKNWAIASGSVPIVHLVLPRSIGHIERYMSSTLGNRERMNTIIASLAQMRPDIGKPIDEGTPRASAAAKQVANWILVGEEDSETSWPLPSIGSVKAVIEFQTQRSPESSTSSAAERTKRPLVS
jgi:hypothetical protein